MLQDPGIDLNQFFSRDELVELEVPEEFLPPVESTISGDEDEVPEVPATPETRLGDLYILGAHRVLCGDATKASDYNRLLGGASAEMCWTDPPYNVALGKEMSVEEARIRKRRTDGLIIQNDSMSDEDFDRFLAIIHGNIFISLLDGSALYVAHADSYGLAFRKAFVGSGMMLKQCLIWVKSSLVMGRQDYQWKHEPILYGWKPGAAHRWMSDRKQTTVLLFDKPSRSEDHPTMKPVALVEYCIGNSSAVGDRVLDPFGGSGTTLIACEKSGRQGRLLEIDPKYVDVIVRRWMLLTGKTAQRFNASGEEVPLGALANPKM